ncbi:MULTISPECIES: caspase family protein [Nostoc]|uniref:Caspase family protein n=1 Tax=Nostoc paludosum FACHB-159 TaxID=2692908 RepID=A0ABR8KL04_9NOSO|nr:MULTISPECIES: caspase family protein [Nostoc]MBD2683119.1 caspase family protein [Nostoc sp. FACHB-857]MBD2739481.1 caspase family protein [Nostoc paludosum FACHB-159]
MVNNSQVFSPTQEIGIRNLYALLVGIDNYKVSNSNLNGCVNDIEDVENFLKKRVNNSQIEKLINEQATRQNVIDKFENHLCKAGKDDVVLFYFCGHGAQEEAAKELHFLEYEKELGKKKLETIVCHDSRTTGEDGIEIQDLANKELRYLISKVAKNEPHILVVFDCCHSSSGTRDTDRKEGVRRTDSRPSRAYDKFCFAHDPQIKQGLENRKFPEGKHVFISACLHTETAKEFIDLEGNSRGLFSYFFLKELNSLNATLSYNDLLREVSSRVNGYRRDQTPQVEPIGMTSEELNKMSFLGDKKVIKPRDPYFILSRRDRKVDNAGQLIQEAEWVINGGTFLNLQKDSKLAVYREHSTTDEMKNEENKDKNKLGEIKITTVRVTESVVTFTSKPESKDSIFYAVLTERQLPSVSFYLEGDDQVLNQVKALLKDSPFVAIEGDRNKTHYCLYADNQQFRITDANDRLLVEPIEGYDVNLAVKQVEHIARWRKTREMENPSTTIPKNAIEIEIWHNGKRLTDSHPRLEYQYKDGTWGEEPTIQLKLKNTFQRRLYCTILDIADDYSVSFPEILPEGGDRSWIQLEPGQEYWAGLDESDGHEPQDIPLAIPEEVLNKGVTEYQDLFKLVASTRQFNSSDFLQNSLSIAQPPDRQVARQQKLPNDDWITEQFSLTCVRPKDYKKLTPEVEKEISSGITIKTPPGLSASARFKTTKSATRSMSSSALPSLLEETEAFQFTTSRSFEQGLDVLELQVDTSTINAVKPDSPMIISVNQPLQPNERILAVAHDGQFYLPLGIGQAENDKTEIKIEYLCDPQGLNSDEREIRQAIQLCFRKVVLDNLGRKSSYAWLRKATVNGDGTVSYTDKEDIDTVKAAVAKAKNIVLYIHGIIGDTESMIPSVRYAKANVNEQLKSVEELYDLVLAFDYESLNTPIEETARILKNQLAAVGLTPNHGKTLHIVAHSMGGLVSRSFIEQGNGNEVVSHLIMVGTPNGGSPWATVHDLATTLLSFGLNFSYVPLVPSLLKKLVEAMSVTLREMHSTKSSFFSELKTSVSSRCPYSIIAGSTALIDQASNVKQLLDVLKKQVRRAIEFPFGDEENDIAVAVNSIIDVPQDGSSTVNILDTIACDHLSYFRQTEGLKAIASAISQAFGYPPEPLPPSRSSSPGPRPNPSPVSSGKTGAQPTGKSSKNTSKERTSGSSASSGTKSSISANTLESQTLPSSAQKTASVSPQSNQNHETRTTKWFDTTHVVAIGINDYTRPIAKLENAVNDAETICELFSEKHLLSREPVKHYKLLDEQATLDKIRQNLKSLKTEVKENDRLILYFAGHGIALPMEIVQNATADKSEAPLSNKPQGYLIPQDAEYDNLESYLSMSEFIQSLSDIQCRHCLIILDCCYAGAVRWSLGQDRQVLHKKVFPSVLDLYIDSPAWQILTSSAEDQTANDVLHHLQLKENNRDSNGKSNSPFVTFLEKGLNREADIQPEDGIITINELITYLDDRVEKFTNEAQKRQTPQLCDFPPEKHKRGRFVFLLKEFAEVKKDLPPDPEISNKYNPYRGLESYTEHDGAVFFGREKLIEKLSERVQNDPFTIVLGQSGAGKSSLVKAGLVPKLRKISEETEPSQQSNPEEKTTQQSESKSKAPPVKWVAEIFRPGQLPATALEKALKKLKLTKITDSTKRLLVIDQFEEVETQCRDENEKKNFWNKLIEQLKNTSNKLHLVFTLRSDFEPLLRSKFEDAINHKFNSENDKSKSKGRSKDKSTNVPKSTNDQSKLGIDWVSARFIVPDMEREELQDAIEKPAKETAVFFTLDPNPDKEKPSSRTLVQQLVKEVEGMPGALPLLSFALYIMYRSFAKRYVDAVNEDKRIKREITWDDYRDSLDGEGVSGSLTKRATEEYDQLLTDAHRAMLRRVMLRMISLQGGELARRQVPKKELEYLSQEENARVQKVIQSFSDARLIVEGSSSQGEPYLEPAHDALVKGWSKLQEWIEKEKENLLLQRRLVASTRDWSSQGCNQDSPLLWNQDIARLEQLKKIAQSDKYWLNELELRFFEASVKLRDQQEQEKLERILDANISSSQMLFASNKRLDALANLINIGNTLQEELIKYEYSRLRFLIIFGKLFNELAEYNSINAHEGIVSSISFSPEEDEIFASVGYHDRIIKFWRRDGTQIKIMESTHLLPIRDLTFSSDGKMLASASEDGTVKLWQTRIIKEPEGSNQFIFVEQYGMPKVHEDDVSSISFNEKYKIIVSASSDETVKLWCYENNIFKSILRHKDQVLCVSFSPNGEMIVSGDRSGNIRLWNADGKLLKEFQAHSNSISTVSFSPDNKTLISCSSDKYIRLWSLHKESIEKPIIEFSEDEEVYFATFSPDGKKIASANKDGTIVIRFTDGKIIKKLKGHRGFVSKVRFSPNGKFLISSGEDGTIKFWHCQSKFEGHDDEIWGIDFNANGETMITASSDKTARLWKRNGDCIRILAHESKVYDAKLSPDGNTIVTVTVDGVIRIWNNIQANDHKVLCKPIYISGAIANNISFSPTDDIFLIAGKDGTIKVFNFKGKLLAQKPTREKNLIMATFSNNGQVIASSSTDKTVKLWKFDNDSLSQIIESLTDFEENVYHISFSHDNQKFATVNQSSDFFEIKVWDLGGKIIKSIKGSHKGSIRDLKFNQNDNMIALVTSHCFEFWNINGILLKSIQLNDINNDINTIFRATISPDWSVIALSYPKNDYENKVEFWNLNLKEAVEDAHRYISEYLKLG